MSRDEDVSSPTTTISESTDATRKTRNESNGSMDKPQGAQNVKATAKKRTVTDYRGESREI